jgi:iron complex outermembrane receptor protein
MGVQVMSFIYRSSKGLSCATGTASLLCTAAAISALISLPSMAQQSTGNTTEANGATENNSLDEVIVTARRREERLQDVPLSITAFTSQALETMNFKDTTDLALYTPGLEYTDYSLGTSDRSSIRQLVFRGLNLANGNGVTSGALTFLDGAPILIGDNDVTPDIERVEVIRGPQNVYFGRSTFSGAVNYVTKPITDELSGVVNASVASFDSYDVSTSFEGPLIDKELLGRFTSLVSTRGGEYLNAANSEELGARSTKEFAGTLYAEPSDSFNGKLYLSYANYDDGPSAAAFIPSRLDNCAVNPAHPTVINYYCGTIPNANNIPIWHNDSFPASIGPLLYGSVDGGDNLTGGHFDSKPGFQMESYGSNLILNAALPDGIQFQSISAYHWALQTASGSSINEDVSLLPEPSPYVLADFSFTEQYTDFYQEIRFTSAQTQRFRWTVGANYIDAVSLVTVADASQTPAQAEPVGMATYPGQTGSKTVGEFAGLYFDIFDPLTLSVEGRYQVDDRRDGGTTRPQVFDESKFYSVDPRYSLEYKIDPDLTAYVSYARGTRPGGFNSNLLGQSAYVLDQIERETGISSSSYKEETLDTYEIGLKGALFERRLQGSIDAYYGTLTDFQVTTPAPYITEAGAPISVVLTSNLGSVRIYGVEAEAQWLILPNLKLSPTFAFNQTKILTFPCAACEAITGAPIVGNELPMAPEFSGALSLDYDHSMGKRLDWDRWFIHSDYVYRKSMNIDYENLIKTGDTTIVNLRAGVANRNTRVEVFVTNLFNNLTVTGGSQDPDSLTGKPGVDVGLPDPRTIGARVQYKF